MSSKGQKRIQSIEIFRSANQPWVIMFHGYGADYRDLESLSGVDNQNKWNWSFPNGIYEVPIAPQWAGRAWWHIDIEAYQTAVATGEDRNLTDQIPAEMSSTRTAVFNFINDLKVPWNQIVLAGFSQGAMLATDLFLRAPETPRGLMILSGSLICRPEWKNYLSQRQGCEFFQSHGEHDQVLSIKGARRLNQFLVEGGLKGKLMSFSGGHEIPMPVAMGMQNYLQLKS